MVKVVTAEATDPRPYSGVGFSYLSVKEDGDVVNSLVFESNEVPYGKLPLTSYVLHMCCRAKVKND